MTANNNRTDKKNPEKNENIFAVRAALTCSWSQQPAVQVAGSHGEIKHQGPLAVDGVQDVLHCYWGVGIRVLLAGLPLHQEVSEGSGTTPLRHRQSLIMVACVYSECNAH